MRLIARLLPIVSFAVSISAYGQLSAAKLPLNVGPNKPISWVVKGKPNDLVSVSTAINATVNPQSTTFDSQGKATFTLTFLAEGPGSVTVADATGAPAWAYTGKTVVSGAATAPDPTLTVARPAPAAPAAPVATRRARASSTPSVAVVVSPVPATSASAPAPSSPAAPITPVAAPVAAVPAAAAPAAPRAAPKAAAKAAKPADDGTATSAPWGETIIGLDVSGASSTDAKAVFLAQGMIDWSFLGNEDGPLHDGTASFFGQLRVAGMAQPGNLSGNIGSLSAAATYLSAADNATPDKIVQSIEGSMGIGLQVAHHILPGNDLITGSLVMDFGALTPLSASQANPPVYTLTNQILQQYAGQIQGSNVSGCAYTTAAPTCYVAFIPQDRTHFYRHYEAGFRVRLYEKAASGADNTFVFPGNLDMMIGQNEYVTKGKLSGFVLHFGGLIPVPKAPYIYGFGAMDTTLSGESLQNDAQQLILQPAPSSANLTYLSPSVYTITVGQPKRDRYRLGFGVDLIHLIQAVKPKPPA